MKILHDTYIYLDIDMLKLLLMVNPYFQQEKQFY